MLDNGKEFHGDTIQAICSLFGIEIRWRRRSKPRDSTLVERAIGVTEQELLASLDGNTIALKDPREVSAAVKPENHIAWTMPALHGSLEHFLFEVQAKRIHARFGMSPRDWERRLLFEFGSRSHRMVRFDPLFKLLTSPRVSGDTRKLDRRLGVYVDGIYFWNDRFASSTRRHESVPVRTEMWNASVVYVCFNGEWVVAQARDGRRLEGRFGYELEMQAREEKRRQRTAAANDKQTTGHAHKKSLLLDPMIWDERLREQCMEEHILYARLGMVEAMPDAVNPRAAEHELGQPRGSDLGHLEAQQGALQERSLAADAVAGRAADADPRASGDDEANAVAQADDGGASDTDTDTDTDDSYF